MTPASDAPGTGARRADRPRASFGGTAGRHARRSRRLSADACSRRLKSRASPDAIASGSTPFPDPDPELNGIEQQGKAVFNRACATCHGGSLHPSGSTPEATIVRPIVRYHNIQTACPRPATDGYLPCPARLAGTRARIASRSPMARPNIHDVRSRTIAADRPDRRSRDDGRHPTAGNQQDRPVLSQQFRSDARGRARPLRRVLPASGPAQPAAEPAAAPFVERPGGRSWLRVAGGTSSVAGIPPKALNVTVKFSD